MADISDILKEISDVKVQYLSESLVKSQDKKRTADTEITFATREVNTSDLMGNCDKTALIVWVGKSDFNAAIAKLNGEQDG